MSVNVSAAVSAVTLAAAKAQLRIEHDFEDGLITNLILTATQGAEMRLKRPIISREGETMSGLCESVETVPASIAQWILLTVAYWYSHREIVSAEATHEMPFSDNLLDAWRHYE